VAVYHGPTAYEPVIYIVEFGEKPETYTKLALCWDMLHLVPRYPGDEVDQAYCGPLTGELTFLPEHAALFEGVDDLFVAGTFLKGVMPQIGHMSIETALRHFIPQVRPKRAWIVHYDGAFDPVGMLSREQLQDWIDGEKRHYGLESIPVRLASHGMTRSYPV